jgi:hypothetical protein
MAWNPSKNLARKNREHWSTQRTAMDPPSSRVHDNAKMEVMSEPKKATADRSSGVLTFDVLTVARSTNSRIGPKCSSSFAIFAESRLRLRSRFSEKFPGQMPYPSMPTDKQELRAALLDCRLPQITASP